jgi:hypothetical protein
MSKKKEAWLEFGEMLVTAILVGLGWTQQLSFLVAHSRTYWTVCILTSLYLIFLAIRVFSKLIKEVGA